jgi:hypothetical protein
MNKQRYDLPAVNVLLWMYNSLDIIVTVVAVDCASREGKISSFNRMPALMYSRTQYTTQIRVKKSEKLLQK